MKNELFTIGYSSLSMFEFIDLLKRHNISAVADVRSSPFSKFKPEFNSNNLQLELAKNGISYVFLGKELGARREETECYFDGRVNFSKVKDVPAFKEGIQRIIKGIEKYRIVLMCAEKDHLYCHRTILICRNLRKSNIKINHILEDGKLENHNDAEERLRLLLNIQPTLFDGHQSIEQLIEKAYDIQGEQIAYEKRF
ncbi:MAG: DUF488 family protein [Candidatus Hodarchaeota archaeon]